MALWKDMSDVERDIYEYSQMEYPRSSLTTAPPKSISEYRARTTTSRNPGIFDDQPERKEIFISGRGKHHPGTIIRPGQPVYSTPEEDLDIRKKIREVSGLGYSNEIIENYYGQQRESSIPEEEDEATGIALPNLKLSSTRCEKKLEEKKLESNSSSDPSKKIKLQHNLKLKEKRKTKTSEKSNTSEDQ